MEPRAHHLLIGLFSALAVAGLLWFGVWLAAGGPEREADPYDVVFSEEVSGLSVGSQVLYNGIRVGVVHRLGLDPADPRRVVARIRLQPGTPVRQDTRAELGMTAIVTGIAHVALSGGSPDSPPLRAAEGHVPVIVAQPSPVARLRAESDDLLDGVSALIEGANALLAPDNTARIARVLEHLEQTTGTLAAQQHHLRDGLQALAEAGRSADRALREASAALHRSQQLLSRADTLLESHGEEIVGSAARAMASLERSAAHMESLLADNQDAFHGALDGLNDVAPALQDLRGTLASLRDIAARFEDDPAGYLLDRERVRRYAP